MGRDLHWKAGSFYRKDDFSGFPVRAERTKKVWTGMIVAEERWEPRQPQDLVRGVADYQSVPEARPLPPNQFVGPVYLQLAADVGPGATVLPLASVADVTVGDAVAVMMNNGVLFATVVRAILPDAEITIAPPLNNYAASGNVVTDYRAPPPVGP